MRSSAPARPTGWRDPRALSGLPADAPVAVALSGGADSVALLSLLAGEGEVTALHVHHGIRGAEADRDEAFCRSLAEQLGVKYACLRVDAPALARERKVSLETAAREARYAALGDYLTAHNIPLLVTAHHADDQLETILQHLLRGSGRNGLCGIPACRTLENGVLVARPLLAVTRASLREYLAARGLSFVTDSTNESACCTRNHLRLSAIPALTEHFPAAAQNAARCAETLAEDEAFLASLADDFLAREGSEPPLSALAALPRPIFVRVVRRLLPVNIERVHLESLHAFCQSAKKHASLSLPNVTVRAEEGRLTILREGEPTPTDYYLPLCVGENNIPEAAALVVLAAHGENYTLPDKNVYKYATRISLSSAMIKGELGVRPRHVGDRILSGGMHKTVRRLAGLSHLPPSVRARMPLLVDGAGVLAVPMAVQRDGSDKDADLSVFIFFN